MSKNIPPAEYPQLGNSPLPPPQQYQSPPGYDAQQYPPATEPQAIQVVVQQQPQVINAAQENSLFRPSYLIFSIITFAISVVFVCCFFPMFLCTIPALIYSILSYGLLSRGESESARASGKIALGCNITAVICFVLTSIITIIGIASVVAG